MPRPINPRPRTGTVGLENASGAEPDEAWSARAECLVDVARSLGTVRRLRLATASIARWTNCRGLVLGAALGRGRCTKNRINICSFFGPELNVIRNPGTGLFASPAESGTLLENAVIEKN